MWKSFLNLLADIKMIRVNEKSELKSCNTVDYGNVMLQYCVPLLRKMAKDIEENPGSAVDDLDYLS